jgi:hypothetical protein
MWSGPIHHDTIRTDHCDCIRLRNILHALDQKRLDCRRSHLALEILQCRKVQSDGFRSRLLHDHINNLDIPPGLLGENDTHAVRTAEVIVECRLATVPDHQARARAKGGQDQCAEPRGGQSRSQDSAE